SAQSIDHRSAEGGILRTCVRWLRYEKELRITRRGTDIYPGEYRRIGDLQSLHNAGRHSHRSPPCSFTLQQTCILQNRLQVGEIAAHANASRSDRAARLHLTFEHIFDFRRRSCDLNNGRLVALLLGNLWAVAKSFEAEFLL